MFLRKIYYLLSPSLRRVVRIIYFLPVDLYERILNKRSELVPPRGLIFIGRGNFEKFGDTYIKLFKELCELKPEAKVLDIGCGIGRIARPLTKYLNKDGTYYGFDVVKNGIDWCNKAYIEFPNFHFKYVPLKNDLYNLSTSAEASQFTFPYNDDFFDLIIITSVFTHMQLNDVNRYISEISRVLKKGKYCFCTFFLITKDSDEYLKNNKEPFFKYRYDNFFLHDNKVKDANIAFRYEEIEKNLNASGLVIKSFYPGWWAGKEKNESLDFQDVVIITK